MNGSTWHPLLAGALRDAALAVAVDIAETLRAPARATADASLSGGAAGLAIFYAYLDQAFPGRGYAGDAVAHLDRALALVSEQPLGPALYAGFPGVAWALEHLTGRLLEHDDSDANAEVDAALHAYLARLARAPAHPIEYDLISGLVGLGVYALERWPRPSAVACLERVVALLDSTAAHTDAGITWWTAPALLSPPIRRKCPDGHYNVGLAHGVPGIVAVLAGVCARGLAMPRARALLDGALAWLLAQELPASAPVRFPSYFGPGIPRRPARQAWCYGDPGVAAALLVAGTALDEPRWREHALRIARHAAGQPPEHTGVQDVSLCHGAASMALLYNRMFQATGDTTLAEAARIWTERLLAMRRPGQGLAGFITLMPVLDGAGTVTARWQGAPGILMGASGIGLTLLAAATSLAPDWDRMLLISMVHHD